jgi:hypothetical protein
MQMERAARRREQRRNGRNHTEDEEQVRLLTILRLLSPVIRLTAAERAPNQYACGWFSSEVLVALVS